MNSFKKKSKKIKKKHDKKGKKDKKRRRRSSSSSSSSSDSSLTSSSSTSSDSEKHKHKKRKHKKDHKRKKAKRYDEKSMDGKSSKNIPVPQNQPKSDDDNDFSIPLHLMDNSHKKPETKEEYEKRQSVLRRVVDEETGRTRLIKGMLLNLTILMIPAKIKRSK